MGISTPWVKTNLDPTVSYGFALVTVGYNIFKGSPMPHFNHCYYAYLEWCWWWSRQVRWRS